MLACLYDLSLVEDVDNIGFLDGTETMCNCNSCAALCCCIECNLNNMF
jgi:hypothetical protein